MTASIATHGERLAPLMREAGFRYVFLGIENVLDEDLAFLKAKAKNSRRQQGMRTNTAIAAVDLLHRHGMLVVGGLMLRREPPVQSAAEPPPEPATVAVAAAPAAVEAPTPQSVPVPTPPEAAPSAAAEPAAQPNSSAAPSPGSKRVTIKKYSEKRVLLAPPVAASAPVATPASAPPGRRNAAASMPGSGL